jgi:hypothetical protein
MASGLYPSAIVDSFKGTVDYDTDTFYCLLMTNAYTPDFDSHTRRSSLTASECAATGGYTAGGVVVTVSVAAYDTTNNRLDITLGGFTIAASTITARYAAYYKRRGGADTADELIGLNDFGSDKTSSSGDFIVNSSTFRSTLN